MRCLTKIVGCLVSSNTKCSLNRSSWTWQSQKTLSLRYLERQHAVYFVIQIQTLNVRTSSISVDCPGLLLFSILNHRKSNKDKMVISNLPTFRVKCCGRWKRKSIIRNQKYVVAVVIRPFRCVHRAHAPRNDRNNHGIVSSCVGWRHQLNLIAIKWKNNVRYSDSDWLLLL